jgi:hypothetical protein
MIFKKMIFFYSRLWPISLRDSMMIENFVRFAARTAGDLQFEGWWIKGARAE